MITRPSNRHREILGALCKRAEDFGTHLDGRLDACGRGDADHRRIVDEVVRQIVDVGRSFIVRPMRRLAEEMVFLGSRLASRSATRDRHCAVGGVVNDGGQDGSAPFIEDHSVEPLMTLATKEFVVPRSIPRILPISIQPFLVDGAASCSPAGGIATDCSYLACLARSPRLLPSATFAPSWYIWQYKI